MFLKAHFIFLWALFIFASTFYIFTISFYLLAVNFYLFTSTFYFFARTSYFFVCTFYYFCKQFIHFCKHLLNFYKHFKLFLVREIFLCVDNYYNWLLIINESSKFSLQMLSVVERVYGCMIVMLWTLTKYKKLVVWTAYQRRKGGPKSRHGDVRPIRVPFFKYGSLSKGLFFTDKSL